MLEPSRDLRPIVAHATSTISSTSTGASNGSSDTPTAERACDPGVAEHLTEELATRR